MSYYSDCLDKFNALPEDIKDDIGGFAALEKISQIENAYGVKLKFLVILVAIGELALVDIPEYLNKKDGIDLVKGEEIKKDLVNGVFQPLITNDIDEFALVSQRIRKYFKNRLLEVLSGDDALKEVINEDLPNLFALEEDVILSVDELLKILLANQEKLTGKAFLLDGKLAEPTAANWLKDFIKKAGTGMVDNLVISKYVIDSENGKKNRRGRKKNYFKFIDYLSQCKIFFPMHSVMPPSPAGRLFGQFR